MPTRRSKTNSKPSVPQKSGARVDVSRSTTRRGASPKNQPKRETVNFRIKLEDRTLIDRAATLAGKSRTDFLLEAGKRAATDALLDQVFFQTDAAAFAAFVERLDAPPRPNDRLMRTLAGSAPWDA